MIENPPKDNVARLKNEADKWSQEIHEIILPDFSKHNVKLLEVQSGLIKIKNSNTSWSSL